MNEETSKAQLTLNAVKERDRKMKLITVKVNRNTWVVMPVSATPQEIQTKITKYKTPKI